jgi:hypothetical protein
MNNDTVHHQNTTCTTCIQDDLLPEYLVIDRLVMCAGGESTIFGNRESMSSYTTARKKNVHFLIMSYFFKDPIRKYLTIMG